MCAAESIDRAPQSFHLGLAAALLTALALRALNLQGQSLFSDEIIESSIARLDVQQIIKYPDGFPPLYHLMLAAWTSVMPSPEAGRWLSVLAGVAAVYAVGRWVNDCVSARAGVSAAFLLAISPLHIYLSQETRAYSLYLCLAAFTLLYFFRGLQRDDGKSWIGFSVSAALAVNTHYYAALLAALLFGVLVYYRRTWLSVRRGFAAFVALGISSLPALALLPGDVAYQSEGFAGRAPLLPTLAHTAYVSFAGFSLGPSLTQLHVLTPRVAGEMAAPWIALFAVTGSWLLWRGWLELRERPHGLAIIFLAVASAPLIGAAGAMADVGPKVRYWAWIVIPLIAWLAAGAARRALGKCERVATGLALTALIGAQLLSVANRYYNARYANEDLRAACDYLEEHASREAPIFVVSDYMAPPVRYYLNGERTLDGWLPYLPESKSAAYPSEHDQSDAEAWRIHPRTQEDVRGSAPLDEAELQEWLADVEAMAGADGKFWLIYTREFHGDPQGKLLVRLEDEGWIQLESEFPGVRLFRGAVSKRL